ncbi:hypothetical protein B0J14DRAFT_700373 [Halenospora varia]|nr:hypothetical protein B0J14DRAFT_700373 [Halenospora varia]
MGYNEVVCQLCGCRTGSEYVNQGDASITYDKFSGCQAIKCRRERGMEHIAGPGGICKEGYSGHRISVEEMKECHAIQCLAKDEDGNYKTESDEQDFERESNYFLTGVGDFELATRYYAIPISARADS